MSVDTRESWSRHIRARRTVYRFGGAWSQALLAAVPWINALVLMVLLLAVHGRLAIAPGIIFDLPRAPFREGGRSGLTALMVTVASDLPGGEEALVFFDDARYSMLDAEQLTLLAERLRSRLVPRSDRELLLLADKRVPHGEVMRFVNVAREAGAQRINVAERPE